MDHDRILPQDNERETGSGSLLEEASAYARAVLESVQATAGTTYCKGVQINGLKKFAIEKRCWIEDMSTLGIYTDRGSENEVYLSYDGNTVYKLNDFRYSEDNLTAFFNRMEIHNAIFPDCAYNLLGFAENRDGKTCAVLACIIHKPSYYSSYLTHPSCTGGFWDKGSVEIVWPMGRRA